MGILSNGWVSEKATFTTNNQGKIIRNYNHKRLITTDQLMNSVDLFNAAGYVLGQTFSNDQWAVLTSWSPSITVEDGKYKWDLDLEYSTEGTPSYQNSIDPTKQRIVRTWQTQEQTLYIVRDRNFNLIVNSANQPYDGGIPVSIELPTLTYEFNQFNFSGSTATSYSNSLNSDHFSGAAPETLRLKISAKETFEGQYQFWATRYEMAYFPLGWQPQPVNAGLYQLISGKLTRCKDRDQQDATSPMPLDENGLQIPIADLPDAAYVNKIEFFNTGPFGSLGMPSL
jgi:hypothetical protein